MSEAVTLKCVVAWSHRRHLCDTIGEALSHLAEENHVRRLGGDAHLVWTHLTPAAIRDQLRALLESDEGLIVVEFEAWSGYGKALDQGWLLARGH